jgi:hypothetical protein
MTGYRRNFTAGCGFFFERLPDAAQRAALAFPAHRIAERVLRLEPRP